jgi:hypothetical protein
MAPLLRLPPADPTPIVERCVPAHLLCLAAACMQRRGWELRTDVLLHLDTAAVLPLADLPDSLIQTCASRTDRIATALLDSLASDDPRQMILACAMFNLKLVDEGLLDDPGNQAVLASLLLITEAREEPDWLLRERQTTAAAGNMLVRARLLGLYLGRNPIVPGRPP